MVGKTKWLQVRVGPVFYARLTDYCVKRGETLSGLVTRLLMVELDGHVVLERAPMSTDHVGLPAVHGGSQSERAGEARALISSTQPHFYSYPSAMPAKREFRCEHGLVFEDCEVCWETMNGPGSFSPGRPLG